MGAMTGLENENKAPRKRERPDNSHEQSPKKARYTYSKQEIQRDDNAYAAGKAALKSARKSATRPQHQNHGPPVNELKAKIRDTKRSLERLDDTRPDIRLEKERALQGYERDLEKAEERRARSAMISKYHFVRFLERKSATKNLKKLLREKEEFENDDEDKDTDEDEDEEVVKRRRLKKSMTPAAKAEKLKDLDSQISTTRIDINYAIYCPLTEKYISLYPNRRRGGEDGKPDEPESNIIRSSSGEKPPLWYTVKESMEDGTLELLRDGKLGVGISGQKNKGIEAGHSMTMNIPVLRKRSKEQNKASRVESEGKKSKDGRKNKGSDATHKDNNDDQDSDGGFFEK